MLTDEERTAIDEQVADLVGTYARIAGGAFAAGFAGGVAFVAIAAAVGWALA